MPECTHIMPDGKPCGEPAEEARKPLCAFHRRIKQRMEESK